MKVLMGVYAIMQKRPTITMTTADVMATIIVVWLKRRLQRRSWEEASTIDRRKFLALRS